MDQDDQKQTPPKQDAESEQQPKQAEQDKPEDPPVITDYASI